MHAEAPGGYPLTPLGMPSGARVVFLAIFGNFGLPFWSPRGPFGTHFRPSKPPSTAKETPNWS